ncbi:MAG TPA: hypothetical protein VIK66_04540 [Gaiellaceae bacterium]|jgi:hypothetical protein
MGRWRILDGPNQNLATWVDGELWVARIENVDDPAQQKLVSVVLSRAALAAQDVPDEVARARETHGRTAIEQYLDEADPPPGILVAGDAVTPSSDFPTSPDPLPPSRRDSD